MYTSQTVDYATDDETEIKPQFLLRFEELLSHPGRGVCFVDVLLKNSGTIAASFPFFCLTALGLNISPAPGWTQQELTMVRKMQRFTAPALVSLDPGVVAHCCTINLRYKSTFGGCLEFEAGSEHLLADFPNLNLTCVVGAGNYPSKRILLQVPATALRTIIIEGVKHCAVAGWPAAGPTQLFSANPADMRT